MSVGSQLHWCGRRTSPVYAAQHEVVDVTDRGSTCKRIQAAAPLCAIRLIPAAAAAAAAAASGLQQLHMSTALTTH